MKSGIYCLTFKDGSMYIGKSIDIERRWKEHTDAMSTDRAANKIQAAFNNYGYPSAEILLECHSDHIDLMETYFICKLQPSLNTVGGVTINNEDLNVLRRRTDLLQLSTAEHILHIEKQETRINGYEKLVNSLINELKQATLDHSMNKLVEALTKQVKDLEEEIGSAEQELIDYKNLPWYKKIFRK
jgi:group I intron endonuclease